jgi:succinyl-CoA synthetase alpha subunit
MAILLTNDTRVVTQGITGNEGSFHTRQAVAYGTAVVAGVTPGKGGMDVEGIPVYNRVADAVQKEEANASGIYVPAAVAPDAILEAVEAEVELIVCLTEHIPTLEMVKVKQALKGSGSTLIGPNCPGIATPGAGKIGFIPNFCLSEGSIGVISRSGTLTYEVLWQLTNLGLGQSTAVGIGGDAIVGSTFVDMLARFEADAQTKAVVLIGEIGGSAEEEAAEFIEHNMSKPVVAFIAGRTAPPGKRMGHAGAIITGGSGSFAGKVEALKRAGVTVEANPAEIGKTMQSIVKETT